MCYGLDAQGAAIAGTHADGVFTPLGTAPTAAAPTGAAPTASFGPGMQLVGTDIQPGTYRATSEEGGFALCHWSRLSGVSGDSDDRISYESVHDAGVQVLTEIAPTDFAFESSGCTWTRCDDCVSGTARLEERGVGVRIAAGRLCVLLSEAGSAARAPVTACNYDGRPWGARRE